MITKFSSRRPLTDVEEAEIQKMIALDPDAPEATDEELANAKPFAEVFPDLAAGIAREIARRGRPAQERTKTPVTIRLDDDLVAHFKATGKGWQTRINAALRKVSGLES